jgi:hypothetical protein
MKFFSFSPFLLFFNGRPKEQAISGAEIYLVVLREAGTRIIIISVGR